MGPMGLNDPISASKLFVSDQLFFLIEDGQILVWNYQSHEQYLIEIDYFLELLELSRTNQCHDEKICRELLAANLVSETCVPSQPWGWDILSKIFHIGTQNVGTRLADLSPELFAKNYINHCVAIKEDMPTLFHEREGEVIALPPPDISLLEKLPFFSVLKNRKTCRVFNAQSITLEELSSLLYASFGLIHGQWHELDQQDLIPTGIRTASPASGGLHSEEAYIVAYRITGLQKGLYHYRLQDHQLTLLKPGDFEEKVVEMNYQQFFSEGMAFGIYITSRFEKLWWKYKHSRAYRAMLLDIGHVSQTFLLCSTALGMQTWMTGAFHDTQVEDFLNIDVNTESVILFVGAGKGTNQAIPKSMIEQLNN